MPGYDVSATRGPDDLGVYAEAREGAKEQRTLPSAPIP